MVVFCQWPVTVAPVVAHEGLTGEGDKHRGLRAPPCQSPALADCFPSMPCAASTSSRSWRKQRNLFARPREAKVRRARHDERRAIPARTRPPSGLEGVNSGRLSKTRSAKRQPASLWHPKLRRRHSTARRSTRSAVRTFRDVFHAVSVATPARRSCAKNSLTRPSEAMNGHQKMNVP